MVRRHLALILAPLTRCLYHVHHESRFMTGLRLEAETNASGIKIKSLNIWEQSSMRFITSIKRKQRWISSIRIRGFRETLCSQLASLPQKILCGLRHGCSGTSSKMKFIIFRSGSRAPLISLKPIVDSNYLPSILSGRRKRTHIKFTNLTAFGLS